MPGRELVEDLPEEDEAADHVRLVDAGDFAAMAAGAAPLGQLEGALEQPLRAVPGQRHAVMRRGRTVGRALEPGLAATGEPPFRALDRKSTRMNSSHQCTTRMPASA